MAKKAAATTGMIVIPPIEMETIRVPIRGIGSLVVHNWSIKAIAEMLAKQMQRQMEAKEAKDPENAFKESLYVATDGTFGMPVTAFKNAMVRAAKSVDMEMIQARQMIFIEADCREDREFVVPLKPKKGDPKAPTEFKHCIQTDLVRLIGKRPEMRMDLVRLNGKTADIRFRGEFERWSAVLTIRYRKRGIDANAVVNLVNIAGLTVGVGEGRPEKSTDMGWGKWELDLSKKATATGGKRRKVG